MQRGSKRAIRYYNRISENLSKAFSLSAPALSHHVQRVNEDEVDRIVVSAKISICLNPPKLVVPEVVPGVQISWKVEAKVVTPVVRHLHCNNREK